MINAKGFNPKGPFQTFDEMVFDDKKNTDMVIQIAPRFTAQEGGWKTNITLMGQAYTSCSYSGKASLVGKINLSGIEPLTGQNQYSFPRLKIFLFKHPIDMTIY